MKYCVNCKRINTGQPVFCQFCGKSFYVRICRGCGHMNPTDALACRKCGRTNLSEPSGNTPNWSKYLKIYLWSMAVLMVFGLINAMLTNPQIIVLLIFVGYLFVWVYSLLPEIAKKLFRVMLNKVKEIVLKKDHNI